MNRRNVLFLAGGLAVALLVVLVLAPNASSDPDGLQRVAQDQGFVDQADDAPYELLPGYTVPGVDNETATRIIAGALGTLLVTGFALGAGWALRERARRRQHEDAAVRPPAAKRA